MLRDLGYNNRLLMVSLFIWALGEGLWVNFRQLYLVELGATPLQVGTALAIESIARAMLLIPAGYIGDKVGARNVVILSWVLGIAGPVLMIPARRWEWAIPGMVVYALSAFAIPSVSALALLSIPDTTRPMIHQHTLTAIFAAYPAGLIVSPYLGGAIARAYDIRTCLWIGAALFFVSLLVVLLVRHVPPVSFDHHDERPRDLFRNRRFWVLAIYFAAAWLVANVGFLLAPNFLQEERSFTEDQIGLLFSVAALGTVLVNLFIGRISRAWSYTLVLMIILLAMLGAWQFPSLNLAAVSFVGFGAVWSTRTLATSGVANVVNPRNRGLAFGMLDTLNAIALAFAARAAGQLFAIDPGYPFAASIGGLAVMIVLWLAVRGHIQAEADRGRSDFDGKSLDL
jgi:MFS family permease